MSEIPVSVSRIFKYNGQSYTDPGPEYSVDEIKKHLAAVFPEVAQAATEEKKLDDGTLEITFVKRAGTKGAVFSPLVIEFIAEKLRNLRVQLVIERAADGLPERLDEPQAALLADVCQVLQLDDRQVRWVLGDAYRRLLCESAGNGKRPSANP
jgi:PRTRC genetic system protein C